jgi:hypothetical protein
MLKQELIHSHILVAIFCGWEPQKPNKGAPNGYLRLIEDGDFQDVSNDTILEELPYATDWNYLMAAYDEYRNQAEEDRGDDQVPDSSLMDIRDSLIEAILGVNIDLAFKELVRGVNVLNQLKLQES